MNLKKFFFIIAISIILLGLLFTFLNKDYSSNEAYNKLFSNIELDIDNVSRIEIEKNSNETKLAKKLPDLSVEISTEIYVEISLAISLSF